MVFNFFGFVLVFLLSIGFLPYRTDAPLYHRPIATISIIVVNVMVFWLHSVDEAWFEFSVLWIGDTISPFQWLTSVYTHFDSMHLFGNMVALLAFGSVVEGKVGSWWMLLLYHTIGLLESASVQMFGLMYFDWMYDHRAQSLLNLFHDRAALKSAGASGAIFGLMGLAFVWAPSNNVACPFSTMMGTTFPLFSFVFVFAAMDFFTVWMQGLRITGELFHLVGFGLGIISGFTLFFCGLVDCEGYDLIAMVRGKEGCAESQPELYKSRKQREREQSQAALQAHAANQEMLAARERIQTYLAEGKVEFAIGCLRAQKKKQHALELSEGELKQLIAALQGNGVWPELIPVLKEYIQRFPAQALVMRLNLAKIQLSMMGRPRAALRELENIDPATLNEKGRHAFAKIVGEAKKRIDEGEIELSEES